MNRAHRPAFGSVTLTWTDDLIIWLWCRYLKMYLNLHTKNGVSRSRPSKARAQTGQTHTDRQTDVTEHITRLLFNSSCSRSYSSVSCLFLAATSPTTSGSDWLTLSSTRSTRRLSTLLDPPQNSYSTNPHHTYTCTPTLQLSMALVVLVFEINQLFNQSIKTAFS